MSRHSILPVLLYHSIAPGARPEQHGWITPPELFADHMAYLQDEGYRTLTVSEYAAMLVEPMVEAPEQTVVITFDDGFADFAEHAVPVLTRHEIRSTMYIVTGCVGSTSTWLESVGEGDRLMMGWSDLEALPAAGVEIGAHTHSHPQLDIISRDIAWEEIRRSRGVLEDRLGHEIPSFAYPFGFHGPRVRALVERAGFKSACAVKDALSGPGDDPLAIARVIVPGDTSVGTLSDLLAGRGRPPAWRGERTSTKAFRVAAAERRPGPEFASRLLAGSNGRKDCRECGAAEADARPMTCTEAEPMVPRTARRRSPRRSQIRRAKRNRRVLVGVIALIAVAISLSVFAARDDAVAEGPTKGQLLFNESFDGDTLNLNRWSPCYHWATDGCTNLSNNELEWYVPEQVKVSDGLLSLEADKREVIGLDDRKFDYVSGLISGTSPERTLFAFKYGYVESRVQLPKGRGLWSALWMLPVTRESEPELDIFETVGEHPELVTMHTHWVENGKDRQRGHKYWADEDMTVGWHTFGLEWKPDSLTWYVDDVARWRVTDPEQIPSEDMYLLANLAVGGRFTQTPDAETPFPSSLNVDYIRVWGTP